jgi:hypothetical protein
LTVRCGAANAQWIPASGRIFINNKLLPLAALPVQPRSATQLESLSPLARNLLKTAREAPINTVVFRSVPRKM